MGQAVCTCVPGLLLYVDIGFRLGPIYNYKLCLCWAAGLGSSNFFTGVQRGEKMLGTSASLWIRRGRLTPMPTRSLATDSRERTWSQRSQVKGIRLTSAAYFRGLRNRQERATPGYWVGVGSVGHESGC